MGASLPILKLSIQPWALKSFVSKTTYNPVGRDRHARRPPSNVVVSYSLPKHQYGPISSDNRNMLTFREVLSSERMSELKP